MYSGRCSSSAHLWVPNLKAQAQTNPSQALVPPTATMVSVLTANVVTACIECTLYGIFLVLALVAFSLWVRRHASDSPRPRWRSLIWDLRRSPLIMVNLFFVVTITAHWVVGIHRLLVAVVSQGDTTKSTAFYSDLRQTTEIIRCAFLFLDMLVGDITITYRTWLVWRRDFRVVIFPTFTISGLLGSPPRSSARRNLYSHALCCDLFPATAIGLMYLLLAATPSQSIFATAFGRWIIGFCAATLVTNTYGTGMIMYRMWTTNRARQKHGLLTASGGSHILVSASPLAANAVRPLTLGPPLPQEAMEIFVESAALYSAWTAVFVVLYAVRSPLQTVGSGCSPTITGISFMLITVRVNLGWVYNAGHLRGSSDGARSLPSAAASGGRPATVVHLGGDAIPMRAISLSVTRSDVEVGEGKEVRLGEDT
ncbi:hypothetical protein VTO73DRAFT_4524 [Trametes versicolor]